MSERFQDVWLPTACFVVAMTLALGLALAVGLAPWVAADVEYPLLALYAHDVAVRRTSLFSALGLVVTAFVFFRPKRGREPAKPKPTTVAGA